MNDRPGVRTRESQEPNLAVRLEHEQPASNPLPEERTQATLSHVRERIPLERFASSLEPDRGPNSPDDGWVEPRALSDPLPPFPVDLLPRVLADYVRAVAESTQTPPDLSVALCLAVLATAAQKLVEVKLNEDRSETLSVFTAAVLPPSERKSAVERLVTQPLRDHEAKLQSRAAQRVRENRSDLDILRTRRRRYINDLAKTEVPDTDLKRKLADIDVSLAAAERLVMPRLLADDATPQSLVRLLFEQGGRLGMISTEGGVLAHVDGGAKLGTDVYTKAFSGEPLRVDRLSGPRAELNRPALTIGVAVQPDVARRLVRGRSSQRRGLLSRFLFFFPRSRAGVRRVRTTPVPADVRQAYFAVVERLLDMRVEREQGEIVARPLALEDDALVLLVEFEDWVEKQVGVGGPLEMFGWGAKLPGQVLRLAAIFHLVESGMCKPITREAMQAAIGLADYLAAHARAAFGLIAMDSPAQDAAYVVQRLMERTLPSITQHELSELTKGRIKGADRLSIALQLLVDHGFLRRETESVPRKRGTKTTLWLLNPRVSAKHFARGAANSSGLVARFDRSCSCYVNSPA